MKPYQEKKVERAESILSAARDPVFHLLPYHRVVWRLAAGGYGRTLGPLTTAISTGASDMSSGLLPGLPGAVTIFLVKNYVTLEGNYLYELLPGFIIVFLTVILVSAVTAMPSEKALQKFDAAREQVKGSGRSTA